MSSQKNSIACVGPFAWADEDHFLESLVRFHKGGAPGNPPPPQPPVTERQTEVVTADRVARRDSLKRKGFLSTLFAGENDGQNNEELKNRSLLGGGS